LCIICELLYPKISASKYTLPKIALLRPNAFALGFEGAIPAKLEHKSIRAKQKGVRDGKQ